MFLLDSLTFHTRPMRPNDARQPDEGRAKNGEDRRKDKDLQAKTKGMGTGDQPHQRDRGFQTGQGEGRCWNTYCGPNGGTLSSAHPLHSETTNYTGEEGHKESQGDTGKIKKHEQQLEYQGFVRPLQSEHSRTRPILSASHTVTRAKYRPSFCTRTRCLQSGLVWKVFSPPRLLLVT